MMASKPMDSKGGQDKNLYDLIHHSLRMKKAFNKEYLERIASYVPSELTESHSLVTTGDLPSTENEELQKKINNLYKRINELEVANDSLRLKVSVDEATLLEDNNDNNKDTEFKSSVEQLKMQRDMLRAELAKSLEHKKKTDQYSMEAKQHAQRLTAENEQLKESLKRATSEKEQIEATYRKESQQQYHREQSSGSLDENRSAFERFTGDMIEKARLHLVKEEVEREVAERMKQLQSNNEPIKLFTAEEPVELASADDQPVNLAVKEDSDLDHIIHEPVPVIMCSLVIIGLPGNAKTNFIKNLFDLYSISYPPSCADKDIVLTKIDITKDRDGKIQWVPCQGDDCDVLRLILHQVCAEKKINVDQALDELAATDKVSSLSKSRLKSFHELLRKLKNVSSKSRDSQVEMYGMSQVFDFSHKSTAFAQIPVLFTEKKKIITIFVCEGNGSPMYCPRANGEVSLCDCIMFWASYLGHFKPDAHSMLVAFSGSRETTDALLSDLTRKTKEIGVKNIFQGLIFEISLKSGMLNLQAQLNKLFTNVEKKIKLSWLMFHSALIKVSEWPWIPFAVVKQLANIFRISKSELSDVMQFWSSITSILYRDVGHLRDIMFCDTVWLAKELSKVLSLELSHSSLLQYGIVEQCVAEKHWLKISTSEGKTTMAGPHQLLLDYFTGFNLATIISTIEGKQHLQCACYFIPSLLKPCKDVLVKNKHSLYVQFPQSFMPMQIFSHIVIHLLRDEYLKCGLKKTYLYSNKISLHLYSCCDLLLVEHRFSVEIIYDCNYCLRPKEEVIKMIRDNVEECCNWLSLAFSFQLMCPNGEHCIRVPDVRTQHVHCRTCASHVSLNNSQLYWIVEHINLPVKSKDSSPGTIPELTTEHLVKIAEKINARDARRLALELGFFDSEYEHMWSFGHEKRVILYILITWFDRNERIRNKHMYLDRALVATGYRTLATASTDLHVQQRNPIEDSELRMLAEHVGGDWEILAFFCDMDNDDEFMEKLKCDNNVDAAYHILKKWSQSYTGSNPQKELVKHLQQMSLPLVARHFEQGTLKHYKTMTTNKRFL